MGRYYAARRGELRLSAEGMFLRIPSSRGSPTKSAETVEHVLQKVLKPWNTSYKNCEKRGTCPTKSAETMERPTNFAQTVEHRPTKSVKTVEHGTNGLNSPEIIETRRLMSRNLY